MLVNDIGLQSCIMQLQKTGKLPEDLVTKVSVQMGPPNPASARVLEDLGVSTINPPTDLTVPQLAAIRAAVDVPLDVYVEAPDNFGGYVRHMEVPSIVQCLAPVYVKLGASPPPCPSHSLAPLPEVILEFRVLNVTLMFSKMGP